MSNQPMTATYYSTTHRVRRRSGSQTGCPKWIYGCSLGWLVCVLALLWLTFSVSETNWIGGLLTFLPRSIFLVPGLVLLVITMFHGWKPMIANSLSIVLVAWPLMDWQPVWNQAPAMPRNCQVVKVLTCNVQGFAPRFEVVVREIVHANPELICFQEARNQNSLLDETFKTPEWHTLHVDEFFFASRYPLRLVGECDAEAFQRITAVHVEVQSPEGAFDVVNVHLMTARHGLSELSISSVLAGDGISAFESHTRLRELEAELTRMFILDSCGDRPHLVLGDFNMPDSSGIQRRCFGDYQNAFRVSGQGYGYTAPATRHSFWPDNTPWARIDHILGSAEWVFNSCQTGQYAGSDHRLVVATASLPK